MLDSGGCSVDVVSGFGVVLSVLHGFIVLAFEMIHSPNSLIFSFEKFCSALTTQKNTGKNMSAKGKVDTKKLGAVAQEVMEDSKTGVDVHGWKLRSHKGGILSSADEKKFAKELKIKTPGMLFGHSFLRCVHEESGVNIEFDARGALSMVGEADPHLVVKSAKHWQRKKERNDIQVLEGASDWTFSTKYGGTVFRRKDGKESKVKICKDGCRGIDYDKLMRRDLNILFWKEVILFEDELDDNGQASYTVRVVSAGFRKIVLNWLLGDILLWIVTCD